MALTAAEKQARYRARYPDRTKASLARLREKRRSGRLAARPTCAAPSCTESVALRVHGGSWRSYCSDECKALRDRWVERLSRYGLTADEYRSLLVGQAARCAICGSVFDGEPRIDHDHETAAVRGLLCNNCNVMVGMADDSPRVLAAAAAYITRR